MVKGRSWRQLYAQHVHRHQRPGADGARKTRLEAQDACLRDEMRARLNFGDIIGELRSMKNFTAVPAPDANRVRMSDNSP
jgi:hypothetical protein